MMKRGIEEKTIPGSTEFQVEVLNSRQKYWQRPSGKIMVGGASDKLKT